MILSLVLGMVLSMSDSGFSRALSIRSGMKLTELSARVERTIKKVQELPKFNMESYIGEADSLSTSVSTTAIRDCFRTSRECLENLQLQMGNSSFPVTLLSTFTLLRASIENSARGIWLLSFKDPEQAAFHSLQNAYFHELDLKKAFQEAIDVDQGISDMIDIALVELNRILRELPSHHADLFSKRAKRKGFKPPTNTDIIQGADNAYLSAGKKREVHSSLSAWRISSGVIHGNVSVMDSLSGEGSKHTVFSDADDSFHAETKIQKPRIAAVVICLVAAVENIEYFAELLQRKSLT